MSLSEARPSVQVMFSLRFLAGAALAAAAGTSGHPLRAVAVGLVWWLAIVSIYLFNGITDVHEDRVNG